MTNLNFLIIIHIESLCVWHCVKYLMCLVEIPFFPPISAGKTGLLKSGEVIKITGL